MTELIPLVTRMRDLQKGYTAACDKGQFGAARTIRAQMKEAEKAVDALLATLANPAAQNRQMGLEFT